MYTFLPRIRIRVLKPDTDPGKNTGSETLLLEYMFFQGLRPESGIDGLDQWAAINRQQGAHKRYRVSRGSQKVQG